MWTVLGAEDICRLYLELKICVDCTSLSMSQFRMSGCSVPKTGVRRMGSATRLLLGELSAVQHSTVQSTKVQVLYTRVE